MQDGTSNDEGRAGTPAAGRHVRIWMLTGARAGDNAQVRALAEKLTDCFRNHETVVTREEKHLTYNALRLFPNILLGATRAVLRSTAKKSLAPPWPDLVIGVGRRAVPVARWIRRRHPSARIVWLGRPRAPLSWFDLVLTTPQYGLPEDVPNLVMLDLPPAPPPARDERALVRWRERFAHLPRPWLGVLVGGARWPLLFDAGDAHRLGRMVEQMRARTGGGWLVSTSPRTGVRQARALHEALSPPGWFHFWRAGGRAEDNPHRAILALADCFVVTSDSASMLAEAVRTGRTVHLFAVRRSLLAPRWRAQRGLLRWLAVHGLLSPPRDMRAFCQRLVAGGLARWLDPARAECGRAPSVLREKALEEAVERIARWFET